jgi:cleavage stimulation factor subunit 3
MMDLGMDVSQRAARCEHKVERVFRDVLGVEMDGTTTMDSILGGLCTSSVELWLLYIRKRVRDALRHSRSMPIGGEQENFVREWTKKAYEVALENASFVSGNHVLWKHYLEWVKWWIPDPAINMDHALAQQQMINLRSIYQRLVTHPMTGLDQLYQEYEAFERGQSEVLAQALLQDYTPKYQHARSTYLERNRVYNVADLQIGRLATPPVDNSDEDYVAKMQE